MRGEGYSLSDIAAATGNSGSNNNGWGTGDGAWWIIILFLFVFCGWGNNGFGNRGGSGSSGAMDNYVLASDFAQIDRKLDSLANGICDSTFALNNTIVNGNNAIQTSLNQGFAGLNTGLVTQGYESRLAMQGLSSQLANCCCEIREGISGINYNLSQIGCGITNAMNLNTRDIIDNQNANYRAIHEELVANKLEAKNDRIAEQQNEINALRLSASQAKQNAYLLNELKPCPIASYIVPNPNCCYDYTVTRSGCNCGNY